MKPLKLLKLMWLVFLAAMTAGAQLTVTVSPPKMTGSKAVVPLAMKNSFSEKIESARAVVFLLDEQGKMVGQATRWVIGGSEDKPGLAAGATNTFYFVISTSNPPATTNLTAKVSFTRVVLNGGGLSIQAGIVSALSETGKVASDEEITALNSDRRSRRKA